MAGEDKLRAYLKKVTVDLADSRQRLADAEARRGEPIAIVGMACRFPGAADPGAYWRLLRDGNSAVTPDVPDGRYDLAPHAEHHGVYTSHGAFLPDIAGWDAEFFDCLPREAQRMDPHQRLLMELTWEAMEDAGAPPATLAGSRTAVLVGYSDTLQYGRLQGEREGPGFCTDPYAGQGASPSVVAGRLAYHFDLRGPTLTVDTACSSSLVAVHLAAEALRRGECDLAVTAGVFLVMHPDMYVNACATQMLARDGRTKTFDASADGYAMGEGGGVIMLERLSDALRGGRRIHAVIRGSAVNQDGRSNGLTAPNRGAQVDVIRRALASAQVNPEDVGYVEAHGSGTALGDSIEVGALNDVYGARERTTPLPVGAVKTNIGHTQAAAGLAGLIKTILVLTHRTVPPNLHFAEPNDAVRSLTAIRPVTAPEPLPDPGRPPVAGVSSFGWSGTNAHLILEAAPPPEAPPTSGGPHLLPVSAASASALAQRLRDLADALRGPGDGLTLADVAYTLQTGRAEHDLRYAVVADDLADAAAQLAAADRPGRRGRERPRVAFVVGRRTGAYGSALYAAEPVFAAAVDRCVEAAARLGVTLSPAEPPATAAAVALWDFTVAYATADLLSHRGVPVDVVAGAGVGELTAGCLAGVFGLADAMTLLAGYAKLEAAAPSGRPDVADVAALIAAADRQAPLVPMASAASGLLDAGQLTDPAAWAARIVDPGQSDVPEVDVRVVLGVPDADPLGDGASLAALADTRDGEVRQLLTVCAQLWQRGVPLDWAGFWAHPARMIDLPGYPFQRQRFWLTAPSLSVTAEPASSAAPPAAVPDDQVRLLARRWIPAEVDGDPTAAGPVVIIGGGAVATALTAALSAAEVTVVASDAAVAVGQKPTVVDLSALETTDPVVAVATTAKVLARHGGDGATSRILVVTRGGQGTGAEPAAAPAQAAVAALPVVANQEYLHLDCQGLDLDPAYSPAEAAAAIVAELGRRTDEVSIAHRGGAPLVPRYAPAEIEPAGQAVRPGGTYVITGGLGEIGLTIAAHLVSLGAGTIVLISRSGLSADPDDPRAVAVARLRAQGAVIHAPRVDVTNAAAVRDLFASHQVDGVVHAAAEMAQESFRALRDLDAAVVARHFGAKVTGARVLADVLAGLAAPPDWCLLFSSTSAILGGVTFGGYAAANAALDALATSQPQGGTRWVSAGWDTWASTLDKLSGGIGATLARYAMSDAAALTALEQLVTASAPALVVAAGDLAERLPRLGAGGAAAVAETAERPRRRRPDLPQPYAPPTTATEQALAEIWTEVLGIESIGAKDNFFDLGGTSLLVPQLLGRIREHFGVAVATVALFETPTVRTFATHLAPPDGQPAGPAMSPGHERAATLPGPRVEGVTTPGVEPATPAARTRQWAGAAPVAGVGPEDIDRHVAIVGLSGRFPGASDVETFWRNLCDGVESITFFTPEELIAAGVDPALAHDPDYVRARPVLADVAGFDAGFFGLSPRMAALTDPQQRVFLEVCWEALESAGYARAESRGRVGVFGGANLSTYLLGITGSLSTGEVSEAEIIMGNDKDALTTTVSYLFDLHGPSVAVQTFCSTSLVAVHLALRSLREGDCELAIAGGVSIRVPDRQGHRSVPGGQDSHDGHVRTFDAGASGTMFGDGASAVVLKRLADAQRDGDHIYAVIRGSAMNNDGALKVGYTAPSVSGQARVVAEAMADAGVSPAEIGYVEAHGTATELGDPIEVAALTRAFGDEPARQSVPIGSVKTNVGHMNHAAGTAGLIKTALALHEGVIPATLHYTTPNPEIDFGGSPFYVNTELAAWSPPAGQPRLAGVNSLGLGGTNVHVVAAQPPPRPPIVDDPRQTRRYQVLPVSARGEAAADQAVTRLGEHLAARPPSRLADVAYTLQVGRRTFEHRRVAVAATVSQAAAILTGTPDGAGLTSRVEPTESRPVAFLLAGVGEQYPGLVHDLYQREPAFRAALDACLARLAPMLPDADLADLLTGARSGGMDLAAMLGRGGARDSRATLLERTDIAQPLMFAVDYALAATLMQWGLRPRVMLGYSLGEYVAACLAGVLSLDDALALVTHRAALISRAEPGMMLAVGLPAEELRRRFRLDQRGLDIAAINGPDAVVVAGPTDAGQRLAADLRRAEVACRPLATSHAFHSRMLAGLCDELTAWVAANVILNPPTLPYLSNVTGQLVDAALVTDPGYWARHMCQTVQFAAGAQVLLADEELAVVEIGPGQSLGALLRTANCPPSRWPLITSTLPSGADPRPADQVLAECLGRLWLTGVEVDWDSYHGRRGVAVYPGGAPGRTPLPTYPFQRQRYWIEADAHPARPAEPTSEPTTMAEMAQMPRLEEQSWLSVPLWRQVAAPPPASDSAGSWLVYARDADASVIAELRRALPAATLTVVVPGAEYARTEDRATIRPGQVADVVALLRDLSGQGRAPTRVVHLWTRTEPAPADAPTVALGLHTLVALARAAGEVGLGDWSLDIVTSGSQSVLGPAEARPAAATVTGPALIIPLEYPSASARLVDAAPDTGAAQLVAELLRPTTEPAVALRGGRRWVRTYDLLPPVDVAEAATVLRDDGVYLITGGLGGIGLGLAEQLARQRRVKLVLFGRTGLPPAADWDDILAGAVPVDETVRGRVVQVRHLIALGAEVEIVVGDVAEPGDMSRAVAAAQQRFGALHGVLHAAGVPGTGLIQFKGPADSEQVLRPKVDGFRALSEALGIGTPQAVTPDFVVLFSSITSVTGGGPGQVDYCAANAYLDRGADLLTTAGVRTVSIAWGEWVWNAWDDGLAGFDEQTQAFFRKNRATFGITFEEGWRTLLRALASGETNVIVSTQDLPTVVRFTRRFTVDAVAQPGTGEGAGARHPRPELVTPYQEPTGQTEESIAAVWAEALQLERVGAADNFFELGGNSLLGIAVLRALQNALPGAELPPHILYEAPSVAALARFVDGAAGAEPGTDRTARLRAQMRRSGLQAAAARRGRRAHPAARSGGSPEASVESSLPESTDREMS